MEQVARTHYHGKSGWAQFPGYRTQQFRVRGTLPADIDTVLRAGVDLRASTSTPTIEASILRFDSYLVVRGDSSPIELAWKRERASAQKRALVLLLERGTLELASSHRTVRLEGAQIAIVPPGDEPVLLRSHEKVTGIIFSFVATELAPLQIRWHHSDGGVVRQSVLALLKAAARATPPSNPQSANSLRSLLRAAAQALLVEAVQVSNSSEDDTLGLVRLIVESRFQVPGFSVNDIAREAGLTRRVLERRLQSVGATAATVLRERRIQNALALMRDQPGLPAREIAFRSGFSSPVTMRRAVAAARERPGA